MYFAHVWPPRRPLKIRWMIRNMFIVGIKFDLPNHADICFENWNNNITIEWNMLNDLTNSIFEFIEHSKNLKRYLTIKIKKIFDCFTAKESKLSTSVSEKLDNKLIFGFVLFYILVSTYFPSISSISPRDGSEPRYRPLQLQNMI